MNVMLTTMRPTITLRRQLLLSMRHSLSGTGRPVIKNNDDRRCMHWLAHTLDINKFRDDFNNNKYDNLESNDFDYNLLNTRYVTEETIRELRVRTTCCPLNESKLFANNPSLVVPIDNKTVVGKEIRFPETTMIGLEKYIPNEADIETFVKDVLNFELKKECFKNVFICRSQQRLNWDNKHSYDRHSVFGSKTLGFLCIPDIIIASNLRNFFAIEVKQIDNHLIEDSDIRYDNIENIINYSDLEVSKLTKTKLKNFNKNMGQMISELIFLADNNMTYNMSTNQLYGLLVRKNYFHFYMTDIERQYIEKLRSQTQLTTEDEVIIKHITDGIGLNYKHNRDRQLIHQILFTILYNELNR
ncbi:uncharacterized protein LOC128952823 [Oppia nitens]|uniref:uncharacterized protein LOC128952823 n=1 Tax=Oppia nitens TaxID=1686743 RepID=UPI0023DA8E85|nr:uncharacterized protein LOC128952823 [Oppia nitens]